MTTTTNIEPLTELNIQIIFPKQEKNELTGEVEKQSSLTYQMAKKIKFNLENNNNEPINIDILLDKSEINNFIYKNTLEILAKTIKSEKTSFSEFLSLPLFDLSDKNKSDAIIKFSDITNNSQGFDIYNYEITTSEFNNIVNLINKINKVINKSLQIINWNSPYSQNNPSKLFVPKYTSLYNSSGAYKNSFHKYIGEHQRGVLSQKYIKQNTIKLVTSKENMLTYLKNPISNDVKIPPLVEEELKKNELLKENQVFVEQNAKKLLRHLLTTNLPILFNNKLYQFKNPETALIQIVKKNLPSKIYNDEFNKYIEKEREKIKQFTEKENKKYSGSSIPQSVTEEINRQQFTLDLVDEIYKLIKQYRKTNLFNWLKNIGDHRISKIKNDIETLYFKPQTNQKDEKLYKKIREIIDKKNESIKRNKYYKTNTSVPDIEDLKIIEGLANLFKTLYIQINKQKEDNNLFPTGFNIIFQQHPIIFVKPMTLKELQKKGVKGIAKDIKDNTIKNFNSLKESCNKTNKLYSKREERLRKSCKNLCKKDGEKGRPKYEKSCNACYSLLKCLYNEDYVSDIEKERKTWAKLSIIDKQKEWLEIKKKYEELMKKHPKTLLYINSLPKKPPKHFLTIKRVPIKGGKTKKKKQKFKSYYIA